MTLWNKNGQSINKELMSFSSSLDVDIHLFDEDITCSLAHSKMLQKIGILSKDEHDEIKKGLEEIIHLYHTKEWIPSKEKYEDIHSAIELKLHEIIGEVAGKLHSGRSRNDQIATDVNLWMKKSSKQIIDKIFNLQNTFLQRAKEFKHHLIPGYTHLQQAQPITLGYHLLTYIEMFDRDMTRFKNIQKEVDKNPLGSSALSGSTLSLDRKFTASEMGFKQVSSHAMDSISNRDHYIDFLHACSVSMMHLSRLSEEIILWVSQEWDWIKLPEHLTTGSSLMPNKRNPDYLELIRGKVGSSYGNYISLLTTLKGLPLAYNRDLQEDKKSLFESYETLKSCLILMEEIISSFEVNDSNKFKNDFSLATDLADELVIAGYPFREIHGKVKELVQVAQKEKRDLSSFSSDEIYTLLSLKKSTKLKSLSLKGSILKKQSSGSCSPFEIEKLIQKHEQMFGV